MTEHPDNSRRDLSKLEDTYEILSTLHEDRASATYLARHREMGRDVTITIVHMPDGGANNTLTHFASDARLLSSARHDGIVPVIEGRWLDDDTFAVVRVMVRGSTLAETVAEHGPFAQERIAEALEQVSQGLQWARESGVVHRTVTADSVGFQQGSGRVMMTLGLSPLPMDSLPDACADGRTIGALAWSMLSGRSYDTATTDDRTLVDLRPRLSPKIMAATEELLACKRGDTPPDIGEYIELLRTEPETPAAIPPAPVPVEAEPVVATATSTRAAAAAAPIAAAGMSKPNVIVTPPRAGVPVGATSSADAPVVVRSRFRSPVAAALIMVALTVIAVLAVMRSRERDERARVASGEVDSATVMAGERPSPMEAPPPPLPAGSAKPPVPTVDSSLIIATTPIPATVYPNPYATPLPGTTVPQTRQPMTTSGTLPMTAATGAQPAVVQPMVTQPTVAQPTVTQPPTSALTPPVPTRPVQTIDTSNVVNPQRDTTSSASKSTDPCSSSDPGDQRTCFNAALARNDVELNRVYGDVIASMRRRANVSDSDPDPESVRELRAAQRRWVQDRDDECRRRGEGREGAQWAQSRAQCFAEVSAERTRRLMQMRDSIP